MIKTTPFEMVFIIRDIVEEQMPEKVFLIKHKDLKVRMDSRSGGIFSAVSDYVLRNDGVVYGCVLENDNTAKHIRATDYITRDLMRKSKYVQSNLNNTFSQVEADLKAGTLVLFSGTGCQVAGLLSLLSTKKISTDKLITMDIICHGVVSPKIFADYIAWLEEKHKGKVENFLFRDKTQDGWEGYTETCSINGTLIHSNVYKMIFNSSFALRPCCYECKYCKVNRDSDITIGDAWGIKKAADDFNDNRGCSLVIPHTARGEKILDTINSMVEIRIVSTGLMLQKNLRHPTSIKGNREEFWNLYDKEGIDGIAKRYCVVPLNKRIKSKIKYRLKQIIQGRKYYLP